MYNLLAKLHILHLGFFKYTEMIKLLESHIYLVLVSICIFIIFYMNH